MLMQAAVPSSASVVIAFSQKPSSPMYARNAPANTAAFGPAESPVSRMMKPPITIHGVLTKSTSRPSRMTRMP